MFISPTMSNTYDQSELVTLTRILTTSRLRMSINTGWLEMSYWCSALLLKMWNTFSFRSATICGILVLYLRRPKNSQAQSVSVRSLQLHIFPVLPWFQPRPTRRSTSFEELCEKVVAFSRLWSISPEASRGIFRQPQCSCVFLRILAFILFFQGRTCSSYQRCINSRDAVSWVSELIFSFRLPSLSA